MYEIIELEETEKLETMEGIMRPVLFTENVGLLRLDVPPGIDVKPHSHYKEMILLCMSGSLDITLDEKTMRINKGSLVHTSKEIKIGIRNQNNETAILLSISSPPSFKSKEELRERIKKFQTKTKE